MNALLEHFMQKSPIYNKSFSVWFFEICLFLMLSTVLSLNNAITFCLVPSSSLSLELLLSVLTFEVCSTVSFSSSFSTSNCSLFCDDDAEDNTLQRQLSSSHRLFLDSTLFHHKVFHFTTTISVTTIITTGPLYPSYCGVTFTDSTGTCVLIS